MLEEIQAETPQIGPNGDPGFESQNDVHSIHSGMGRLRTRSNFSLLQNQLQPKPGGAVNNEPGITSGGEDFMSAFGDGSAFNQFQVARNLSNQPSFLDDSEIAASGAEGGEFDLEEIENILGSNFGRIQEAMQQLQGSEVMISAMAEKLTEALAGASQPSGSQYGRTGDNQRFGRDHAASGFELESQLAESINKHFDNQLRDDIIAHNMNDEEKRGDGDDEEDFVPSCEYNISDIENMNADFTHADSNPQHF